MVDAGGRPLELEGEAVGLERAEIGVRIVVGEVHLGLGELGVAVDEIIAGLDDAGGDSGLLAASHQVVAVLTAGPFGDPGVDLRAAGFTAFDCGKLGVVEPVVGLHQST